MPVPVALSDSTQETVQGKIAIFDYSGPDFDGEGLEVSIGDEDVTPVFIENQIFVIIPLSESGEVEASFSFPGGKSAEVSLDISEGPQIGNPQRYVSDQAESITDLFRPLQNDYPELWEQILEVDDQIAELRADELREFAVFLKQNLEPLLLTLSDPSAVTGESAPDSSSQDADTECQPITEFIETAEALSVAIPATLTVSPPAPVSITVATAILGATEQTGRVGAIRSECVDSALIVSQGDGSGGRLIFTESETSEVSVYSDSEIRVNSQTWDPFLASYSEFRHLLVNTNSKIEELAMGEASFQALINELPISISLESSQQPADTSNIEIDPDSDEIDVEITDRAPGTLTLTFTFRNPSDKPQSHTDFSFTLSDPQANLESGMIPARLNVANGQPTSPDPGPSNPGPSNPGPPQLNLLQAASGGHTNRVKELIDAGANLEIKDGKGRTPLFLAVFHAKFETAKVLIDAGANPEIKWNSRPPLYFAIFYGHVGTVNALIDAGANVNVQISSGYKLLDAAYRTPSSNQQQIIGILEAAGATTCEADPNCE